MLLSTLPGLVYRQVDSCACVLALVASPDSAVVATRHVGSSASNLSHPIERHLIDLTQKRMTFNTHINDKHGSPEGVMEHFPTGL